MGEKGASRTDDPIFGEFDDYFGACSLGPNRRIRKRIIGAETPENGFDVHESQTAGSGLSSLARNSFFDIHRRPPQGGLTREITAYRVIQHIHECLLLAKLGSSEAGKLLPLLPQLQTFLTSMVASRTGANSQERTFQTPRNRSNCCNPMLHAKKCPAEAGREGLVRTRIKLSDPTRAAD